MYDETNQHAGTTKDHACAPDSCHQQGKP